MAEKLETLQGAFDPNSSDSIKNAAAQVKANVEQLVEDFDIQGIARKVEDFGKANPLGLALTSLTLGLAVGFLLRNQKKFMAS